MDVKDIILAASIAKGSGGGSGGVTKEYVDNQVGAVSERVDDVEDVIPSTATAQNKLATSADVSGNSIPSTSTTSPLTDSADGYVQGINVKGHSHKNKNLLEITATTQTKNGVTFTVNSDRTVTIHGTASGNAIFHLVTSGALSEYDGCIAVVDPTVITQGVSMNLELINSPWTAYVKTGRLPQTINYNGNNDEKNLFLRVLDGVTADTTFKPMICTVADYERDPSYEPYVGGGIKSIGDNDFTIITTDSTETLTSTATITTGLPLRSTLDGTVYDELTNEKVITRCEVVEGEVVPLATPTETPLTNAEIAALAALQTYNSTTHIDATDAPTMTVDYLLNTDNGQAVADIQKDLQGQIDGLKIKTLVYTGTGSSTNTITFPEKPFMVLGITQDPMDDDKWKRNIIPFIWAYSTAEMSMFWSNESSHSLNGSCTRLTLTDTSMSWTAEDNTQAFNISNTTYTVYYI